MSNNRKGGNDTLEFFAGLAMLCVGGYLFMQNVEVITTNIFRLSIFGRRMDGLLFVPLIASIIFLFYKYNFYSKLCVALSLLIIAANVILNLRLVWSPISLFGTFVIFVMTFGGLGLVLRTIFANPDGDHGKNYK